MSGAAITYDLSGLRRLRKPIEALSHLDRYALLDVIGATIESQTRRRITDDKTDPEGQRWQAWSDNYAKTRHAGQSLLEGEGDLVDSLTHVVLLDGSGGEVGSNLIYFATQQYGDPDRNIKARASLGSNAEDEAEVDEIVEAFLERTLAI